MRRAPALAFAAAATIVTLATAAYWIGFLADLPFLPKTIDRPVMAAPALAAAVDVGLVILFGLQHSLMAREGMKARIRRLASPGLERAVYLLATCAALVTLFVAWQPIDITIWRIEGPAAWLLWGLFAFGWLFGAVSLVLMGLPELFGLRQALRPDLADQVPTRFRAPLYYRRVRHPLYLSLFLVFWATPHMTIGHAVFAGGMSLYILIGSRYEERNLVVRFGDTYRDYATRTGKFLPRLHSRRTRP